MKEKRYDIKEFRDSVHSSERLEVSACRRSTTGPVCPLELFAVRNVKERGHDEQLHGKWYVHISIMLKRVMLCNVRSWVIGVIRNFLLYVM